MTEIYLIRHTQAEGNRFRVFQGHWDGGVTELGLRQIALLAERLRELPLDAVYASDLYRAKLTAAAVARSHGLPLQCDPALREINVGPRESRFFGNVLWAEPESVERLLRDPLHWSHKGAETYEHVAARALPALEAIARRHEGGRAAVVSHGDAIRCMLWKITGEALPRIPVCSNTGITVLRWEQGRFQPVRVNDAAHLASLELPSWASRASLRDEPLDLRRERELYTDCYRDAWRTVHGDLEGYNADLYWSAAQNHLRADAGSVLKLLDRDRLVGLVDLDPLRGEREGYGWLSLLYLRPEYRGQGYGIQALARAILHFRALGRDRLRLVVAEENSPARRFYEREGFREIGREEGSRSQLLVLERPLTERRYAL